MALQRRRGHQQGFPKVPCFPKGLCFKNANAHHFSPGERQSCAVLARGPRRGRGAAGTVSLGSRPALSGGRQGEGNLCPSVFLSHGRWWRQLESWMPRGAGPPAPPVPASRHLCLLYHERFAAPESCEGPSTPTLLLQPPAPLSRTANLDGLLWIGAPVLPRPHPSHRELPQGTRSAWGTEGSPEQLHQSLLRGAEAPLLPLPSPRRATVQGEGRAGQVDRPQGSATGPLRTAGGGWGSVLFAPIPSSGT